MTPYTELQKLYAKCPDRLLWNDVRYYVEHGYVFSSPTHILIGERIANGWFIHVAIGVGSIKKFCELMPYWLPYIGWAREHRKNRSTIRWHRTGAIFKKVGYYGRKNTKTTTSTAGSVKGRSRTKCTGPIGQEEAERVPIHHIDG